MKESWLESVVGSVRKILAERAGHWDNPCPFLRSPSSSRISVSAVSVPVPAGLAAIAGEHFLRVNPSSDVSFPQPFAVFLRALYYLELIRKGRTPSSLPTRPSKPASMQSCKSAISLLWLGRWLDLKNASDKRA